jgi:hypothetical protein
MFNISTAQAVPPTNNLDSKENTVSINAQMS